MQSIMFACRRNSCRSQIAEAWAKQLGASNLIIHSSGLEASRVHPGAIATMAEVGIDLSTHTSNALDTFNPEEYDAVISMCGCGASLPQAWLIQDIFADWNIQDPDGQSPEVFRNVREEIRAKVVELLERMQAIKTEPIA